MLACDETATLVQRVEEGDADNYVCATLHGVSWFAKTVVAVSSDGAKPVNVLKCRVPVSAMPLEITPHTGDYLVQGELADMEGMADLTGRTYFQITAVGDNRRGRLSHWLLSGG